MVDTVHIDTTTTTCLEVINRADLKALCLHLPIKKAIAELKSFIDAQREERISVLPLSYAAMYIKILADRGEAAPSEMISDALEAGVITLCTRTISPQCLSHLTSYVQSPVGIRSQEGYQNTYRLLAQSDFSGVGISLLENILATVKRSETVQSATFISAVEAMQNDLRTFINITSKALNDDYAIPYGVRILMEIRYHQAISLSDRYTNITKLA